VIVQRYRLAVVVVCLLVCGSPQAQALTFDWAFINAIGNVQGSITGTVDLVDNTAGQAATAVLVTGYPVDLKMLPPAPFDAMTVFSTTTMNSFDVAAGVVTAAHFRAIDLDTLSLLYFALDDLFTSLQDGAGNAVILGMGHNISFTLDQSATDVPEPASWALVGIGLLGLAAAYKRLRSPSIV
jgi:PEP-CTERM motif